MPTPRANGCLCGVTMRPFQKQITDWCAQKNGLVRVVYYNKNETIGKSVLAKYLEYLNLATIFPRLNDFKNIWDFVKFGTNGQSLFIVFPQKFLSCPERLELWNKIKDVADEYARCASPLQIIIFTHVMPLFIFLTLHSWNVYEVLPEYALREILISWPQGSGTPHEAFSRWDSRPVARCDKSEIMTGRTLYLQSFPQELHASAAAMQFLNVSPVGTFRAYLVERASSRITD